MKDDRKYDARTGTLVDQNVANVCLLILNEYLSEHPLDQLVDIGGMSGQAKYILGPRLYAVEGVVESNVTMLSQESRRGGFMARWNEYYEPEIKKLEQESRINARIFAEKIRKELIDD